VTGGYTDHYTNRTVSRRQQAEHCTKKIQNINLGEDGSHGLFSSGGPLRKSERESRTPRPAPHDPRVTEGVWLAGSAGARSASFCSQLRALVTRAHGRSPPALRRSPCDSGHGDDCWDEAACSGGDAEDGQTSREEAPTGCGCRQKRLAAGDATRFVHGTVEPARHSCAAPPPPSMHLAPARFREPAPLPHASTASSATLCHY
jgi:hypothetical protein